MTEGLLSPVPLSTRSPLFFFRPYMNSSVVIFLTISNSLYPQVCLRTYSTSFISARLVIFAVISVHSFGSRKKFASGLLKPWNVCSDRFCMVGVDRLIDQVVNQFFVLSFLISTSIVSMMFGLLSRADLL